MNTLSVVIITFNEENKIGQCLNSVKDIADEIIVVDSFSTDNTEQICQSYGAKFVSQKWLGYSAQKNFADEMATCDLIFSIDADEALSEPLRNAIMQIKNSDLVSAQVFSMNRLTNYCGRWIKRCGFYPDNKIRIWARGFAHWEGLIHEWLQFETQPQVQLLQGDLLHYSYDSPEAYKKQVFHFADIGGKAYFDRNKKTAAFYRFLSPCINFIRTYFIKGGFLEGKTGWYICLTAAQATRHKYEVLHKLMAEKS